MRILHIITGLSDGGAEAVLYRLCTSDRKNDHHVISLMDEGKYGSMLRAVGVSVTCLGMPRGGVTPRGVWALWRAIRSQRPDVVQTWMYHANLLGGVAARLAGCRNVFWGIHHTDLVPGTTGRSTRLVDRLCARLSGSVPKGIVACAERARSVHIAGGYDASKFIVIPNGYATDLFAPDEAARATIRQELGMAADTLAIGLVGRWDPHKDHANLLAAVARLLARVPNLRVVLAGSGCTPENDGLAGMIRDHGLDGRVHLLGRRSDVPALMNALDVHVLASSGEAFPNVVAEAMACGTPCVTTDVGDAAFIVGDTGWVVPPRDAARLAEAIEEALKERADPQAWGRRRQAARQRIIDEFSIGTMVDRYHAVWQGAIGSSSDAPERSLIRQEIR